MPQYNFGTGNLYATPVGGGAPVAFGALQDVSLDISGDTKMLYGQSAFPLDTARGKVKIDGKASTGQVSLALYNSLFFGGTITPGQNLQAFNEAAAVPASAPYQVTVANAATFKTDLGVFFVNTGARLTQVASAPATGQYTVSNAGVYTFAAADTGKGVVVNYTYGSASTGQTLTVSNPLMGSIPTFQLILSGASKGKSNIITLLACTSSKLSLPFKQDDYQITEIDFSAQDNGAGQVLTWSTTEG